MTKNIKISNVFPKSIEAFSNQVKSDILVSNISLNNFTKGIADMYAYYHYCDKSVPESREQFSISYDLYSNFYIFGGCSTKIMCDVWNLTTSENSEKFQFLKFDINTDTNSRFGHSATYFNKKLYIFGGKIKTKEVSYLGDLEIFHCGIMNIILDRSVWTSPIISTKNYLKPRKNHIAELVGSQILIHGGFGDDNSIFSDCHLLNILPTLKWNKLSFNDKTPAPALGGHCSCLVISAELKLNNKLTVYNLPEKAMTKKVRGRLRERGIYIFGGKNEKNIPTNDLWLLKIGIKPLEWIRLDSAGKRPSPRYLHSMNYYEDRNFLIVYGGRNDNNTENFALNDIFIFELMKFEWIEIKVFSNSPISVYKRCGHSSIIFGHEMIIFGGMSNENYIGSSLFIISLEYCYNYSNEYSDIKDEDKFRLLFKSELEKKKLKKKKSNEKKEYFINSNALLPPIK